MTTPGPGGTSDPPADRPAEAPDEARGLTSFRGMLSDIEGLKNTYPAATKLHLASEMARASQLDADCRMLREENRGLHRDIGRLKSQVAALEQSYRHLAGFSLVSVIMVAVGGALISSNQAGAGWAVLVCGLILQVLTPVISVVARRIESHA